MTEPTTCTVCDCIPGYISEPAYRQSALVVLCEILAASGGGGGGGNVNLTGINSVAPSVGTGVSGTGVLRVVIATDQPAFTNPVPENLKQLNGTNVDVNSGVKSNGTLRVVLATDQPALSTPMPVSGTVAVSGTVGVTQSTSPWVENITQLGGTAVDTNSGNKSAGTLRVVIATDQPSLSNNIPVSGTVSVSGTVAVTQSTSPWVVNQTQWAGTAIDVNSGVKSNGTLRVILATDQPALTTPIPDNLTQLGGTAVATNSGTSSGGTLRVVLATDQPALTNSLLVTSTTTRTSLTAASPTQATVGVVSAQAVASNGSRKGLVLINTSANNISFGIGAAAVLNSGITLVPNGTWTMTEFTFSTGAINAIAAGASSNLAIQEFT